MFSVFLITKKKKKKVTKHVLLRFSFLFSKQKIIFKNCKQMGLMSLFGSYFLKLLLEKFLKTYKTTFCV